jgi:4-hydroxy-2-oxoheptanedioate aldolase
MPEVKNIYLTNSTKSKLIHGEVAVGCGVGTARDIEMAGIAGADFIRLEGEHGPLTWDTLDGLVAVARLNGVDPIARVPGNVEHQILHYLDAGVIGVTVPHTASRAIAEEAVRAAKHFPVGLRGDNFGGKLNRYGRMGLSQKEYYDLVNEATMVIALIEDSDGVENVEEIVATPGVDAIDIGPYDLAQSMGLPPEKKVDEAVEHIVDVAVKAGKPVQVGTACNSKESIENWLKRGCTMFLGGPNSVAMIREMARGMGLKA